MKAAVGVALTVIAISVAPRARAEMPLGNYDFNAPWDSNHSWVWSVKCDSIGCPHVTAIPRPSERFGASPWTSSAHLTGDTYMMTADVTTGLVCIGYGVPTRNTYTWNAVTLTGSVNSTFDAGCGGGPGGSFSYPFTLVRM